MPINNTRGLARWVSELRFEDIPPSVLRKTKLHILNTLAAQAASQKALEGGAAAGFHDPLIQKSIDAIALDFEDYFFMGHPSHSTVVPILHLAPELEANGRDVLAAIVCGSEAAGRLGAACFLGPLNGQMWSFIHLLGAACSVGKLLKLSQEEVENAVGLALSHPPFPLDEGFFGTDAKFLTAAYPMLQGMWAARWAKTGAQGPKKLLEPDSEFFKRYSFHPLAGFLSDWGTAWVSETLSFKKYPGCAYFQSAFELLERISPDELADLQSLKWRVNLFSHEVDRRSPEDAWTPSAVNFSLKKSTALYLHAGRLGPCEFRAGYLREHLPRLRFLSKKIEVMHDASLTRSMLSQFLSHVDLEKFLAEFSLRDLWKLRRQIRQRHPQTGAAIHLGLIEPFLKSRLVRGGIELRHVRLHEWEMSIPVKLEFTDRSGRVKTLSANIPSGSCSDPRQEEMVRRKFIDAFFPLPPQQTQGRMEAWLHLELLSAAELQDLLIQPRRFDTSPSAMK